MFGHSIRLIISILSVYSSYTHAGLSKPRVLIAKDSLQWSAQIHQALGPKLRELTKAPWLVDRLPEKWTILFTEHLQGAGGFHNPRQRDPDGAPMFFLSPSELILNKDAGVLAHELLHMINNFHRPKEEGWVREGLALVAEANVSGKHIRQIEAAFEIPDVSLSAPISWSGSAASEVLRRKSQYAHLQLFFLYMFRHCGGWKLFKNVAFSSLTVDVVGTKLLDAALAESKTEVDASRKWPSYCDSVQALHERFQNIKYWPRFDMADGFLLQDPTLGSRLADGPQTEMPRLSAVAFARPSEECPPGSRSLGAQLCLQVKGP